MATLLNMPAIVADATEAVLYTWFKAAGDSIRVGEPIAEIETEKATVEMEAEQDGILARLIASPGETVAVGAPIAVIAATGDAEKDIETVLASAGSSAAATTEQQDGAASEAVSDSVDLAAGDNVGRIYSSPLARRLAREHGLDVTALNGSGPGGRIIRKDVEAAIADELSTVQTAASAEGPASATPPAPAPTPDAAGPGIETVPFTRMRQAIARRLTESKTTVPHFYLTVDVRMDELLALRKQVNSTAARKITVNDLIVRAIGLALRDEPDANVGFNGDSMLRYDRADISVAIATDGGLITPVVRGVDRTSVTGISATIAEFAARAQAGRIRPDELVGGSFTVSNLGMFGTKEFAAILNPPQSGILAVGAAEPRPVILDAELAIATMMTCTLSADHRVVDGAVAARLMAAFKQRMENPLSLLI
ncbi:dihydrolipoamide acetyltransferase family protein [Crystallibacter degradans]|uniref:dihydrolipoamide acetyltransferase family protein n=1 Tax=Crystallibacter degradans TaxID=2726743 RepID=UPI0014755332|nr:dihydrolipoamide acetyltransferase family protein [Arthrobacter sp. SF27]NMR32434.1 2-oxo acid dehydrogenase subunit E2 [Arthrobacter sp. SF27]